MLQYYAKRLRRVITAFALYVTQLTARTTHRRFRSSTKSHLGLIFVSEIMASFENKSFKIRWVHFEKINLINHCNLFEIYLSTEVIRRNIEIDQSVLRFFQITYLDTSV